MSDLDYKLRCPFCNEGLLFWGATGPWRKCPKCDNNLIGNDELWQELITTRKALDVAVDALNTINEGAWLEAYSYIEEAEEALKYIKELTKGEQNNE